MKFIFLFVLLTISFSSAVSAEGYYVLKVDGARVYVDCGMAHGLREGDSVNVYKIDYTPHPIDGRTIRSRMLLDHSVPVLSATEETSVLLIADARVQEGMELEIEKEETAARKVKSGINFSAEHSSIDSDDDFTFMEAGYRHEFESYAVLMGAGGAEDAAKRYYYGYAGSKYISEHFSLAGKLLVGVTDEETKLGAGAELRGGRKRAAHLLAAYRYYPSLGSHGSLSMDAGFPGRVSPVLKIAWAGIPDVDDSAMFFTAGCRIKISDSFSLTPMAGIGARDADNTGLALNLSGEIYF